MQRWVRGGFKSELNYMDWGAKREKEVTQAD